MARHTLPVSKECLATCMKLKHDPEQMDSHSLVHYYIAELDMQFRSMVDDQRVITGYYTVVFLIDVISSDYSSIYCLCSG